MRFLERCFNRTRKQEAVQHIRNSVFLNAPASVYLRGSTVRQKLPSYRIRDCLILGRDLLRFGVGHEHVIVPHHGKAAAGQASGPAGAFANR
jgi:hypothetical protein